MSYFMEEEASVWHIIENRVLLKDPTEAAVQVLVLKPSELLISNLKTETREKVHVLAFDL